MDPDQPVPRTHLFTLRLWTERLGDGRVEQRGHVRYVLTGEHRSFRDWATLVSYLVAKVQELDVEENS